MTTSTSITIRILEKDNNRKGDLFARLVKDLFLALGYDDLRLNVARSGREIDLEATHRLEQRVAVAECKAQKKPVGGKEVNVFAGKIRPERTRRSGFSITPYFVSLSGFTETCVDQEHEAGAEGVILVDGVRLVTELISGRIVVPIEIAAERAGTSATVGGLILDSNAELLASTRGWIWALYYLKGKQRTHFILIHADGSPLSATIAGEIIDSDRNVDGVLHRLACLNAHEESAETTEEWLLAIGNYYQYLALECGYILLDGLPANNEDGSRRFRLEDLFVPLHLHLSSREHGLNFNVDIEQNRAEENLAKRLPVGEVISRFPHLAVLGAPGAGKSTFLKRLAIAYAFPERRALVQDELPDQVLVPILLRCRELREVARSSFPALLEKLAERANLGSLTHVFRSRLELLLRTGNVLLLVDGLDEISDVGDRKQFVRTILTLLATYPDTKHVITSREAGFRHVAGLLATFCQHVKIADLASSEIRQLIIAWHREVLGDRPDVRAESEKLASAIYENDRIRALAVNPLLVTTLLLVKRWVGQLPTKRSVLYGKAVEVLLMTWNVEGHEPIELDEALPQLCFVAYSMMVRGQQKISRSKLAYLLRQAREELAAELAYTRVGLNAFIDRIEHRSSLLVMTGHEIVDGELTEVFEFRHLTFQEYLTAKAIVEGWYRGRTERDSLEAILEAHCEDERWAEVLPVASVLAGRRADSLVNILSTRCIAHEPTEEFKLSPVASNIVNCLADEVQITPSTLERAIEAICVHIRPLYSSKSLPLLAHSKYGPRFRTVIRERYLTNTDKLQAYGGVLGRLFLAQEMQGDIVTSFPSLFQTLSGMLVSNDAPTRCEGALGLALAAFEYGYPESHVSVPMEEPLDDSVARALAAMVNTGTPPEQFASCWAIVWINVRRSWPPSLVPETLVSLFSLWMRSPDPEIRLQSAWAFSHMPLLHSQENPLVELREEHNFTAKMAKWDKMHPVKEKDAALIANYYLGQPWDEKTLRDMLQKTVRSHDNQPFPVSQLLIRLGG